MMQSNKCFTEFKTDVNHILLPEKFTFPFYYSPHELSKIASVELQSYLSSQTDFEHNFGLDVSKKGAVIGKMFGVLVVKNPEGNLGYLSAFSGKMAGQNHHQYFVPPVYDILAPEGFFLHDEIELNRLNDEIATYENSPDFKKAKNELNEVLLKSEEELGQAKLKSKSGKKERKKTREQSKDQLTEKEFLDLLEKLKQESLNFHFYLKNLNQHWKTEVEKARRKFHAIEAEIIALKKTRKRKSGELQKKIFEHYKFLNALKEEQNLLSIFGEFTPPAGAGECSTPKLLQYAFLNNLEPICMAEFWWGKSPNSEVRQHKNFYPACKSKCEPILGHMLQGLELDDNPLLENPAQGKVFSIVYEDDEIVIVNKPAEFLSVPGKTITDSVQERIRVLYPEATGPLLVHRLDMSTSGLLLVAKTKEAHKNLQLQFIKRSVKKRYVALLDGEINRDNGLIDLPLRVDLDDRPRQLVCYEHGKPAQTKWEVVEVKNGKTRIHLFPLTGRTHQLRVHCAHQLGLQKPIIGDDLYGVKSNRLHLHAQVLEFRHPLTKKEMKISVDADF